MNLDGLNSSRCTPPAQPVGAEEWVVFDLETTGLTPDWDQIIQIAAVRMRGGRMVSSEQFFSYVDPGRSIPAWISQYTGVTDRDVRGAPRAGEVLSAFSRFVGESVLVAHNGHRFDMKFLASECRRAGLPERRVFYHDSLSLSWRLWGRARGCGHGLDAVLQRLQLSARGVRRHDARGDVELLARAVEKMQAQLNELGLAEPLRRYEGALPRVP